MESQAEQTFFIPTVVDAVLNIDERRRKEIYDEIQRIVIDDLPVYYMTTLKNFTAFDKKVGGVSALKGGDILTQNNMQFATWFIAE